MASTNQSPFYQKAEEKFLLATTDEERIECLEIMIRECPKHKGAEKMLAQLKTRLKKLKQSLERQKKSGKSTQKGIKKQPLQAILIGMPNTGKSTFFKQLTNQETKISPAPYTTFQPILGSYDYEDVNIQLVDSPPIQATDTSLSNSADTLLYIIDNLEQIKEIEKHIKNPKAEKIIIHTKTDKLNEQEKRKLSATLKSKFAKYPFFLTSNNIEKIELDKIKQTIFQTFPIIRIYTKEPRKQASKKPMILKTNSTIEDFAEKILTGMSKKIKKAKVWGPSAKFQGQTQGLDHQLKDKDIVELQT